MLSVNVHVGKSPKQELIMIQLYGAPRRYHVVSLVDRTFSPLGLWAHGSTQLQFSQSSQLCTVICNSAEDWWCNFNGQDLARSLKPPSLIIRLSFHSNLGIHITTPTVSSYFTLPPPNGGLTIASSEALPSSPSPTFSHLPPRSRFQAPHPPPPSAYPLY